tara:strand:+ start:167 stop:412 length:246 start_codon:yes stop_codon:yes gene_type:complete
MAMMLNCREVAEQASQALDEPQGFMARLAMRFHLFMCVDCRRYVTHLGLVSQVTKRDDAIVEPGDADVERTLKALMARRDD